jgi:UDP-N-acetylglucosamine 1-carboxyvinyltransferase
MRSSIIFTGAIIARMKEVKTSYPGGCELGLRPIDLHIKAFKELGINVTEKHGYIECDGSEMKNAEIHLDFPSVGATENIMLVATVIPGTTRIINAAKEPEICDLQEFLIKMGARVKGAGTSIIEIEGVAEFNDVNHTVIPDRIVASTYIAATAVTGGKTVLENVNTDHLGAVISVFRDMGVIILPTGDNSVFVTANSKLKALNLLRTSPYPGFPTDSQSIITAALSVAGGTSMIIESIFEQRFRLVDELRKMGADIGVDGRCAVIKSVKKLYGAKVSAPDLRSGAALVVAGLAAKGRTEISNINYIERGYSDIARDLRCLGADIEKVRG